MNTVTGETPKRVAFFVEIEPAKLPDMVKALSRIVSVYGMHDVAKEPRAIGTPITPLSDVVPGLNTDMVDYVPLGGRRIPVVTKEEVTEFGARMTPPMRASTVSAAWNVLARVLTPPDSNHPVGRNEIKLLTSEQADYYGKFKPDRFPSMDYVYAARFPELVETVVAPESSLRGRSNIRNFGAASLACFEAFAAALITQPEATA